MKKILCPTDFSETAQNAIAYAAKLSQKIGASLTLFNVQSLAELTPGEAVMGASFNVAAAAANLEALCDEVTKVFRISCYCDVSTSITQVNKVIGANGSGYDLIVMGTSGANDLSRILLGSHTYHVIKNSSTPLILVPDGCGYSDYSKIIYAFDYWRNDRLPMNQLLKLSRIFQSEVVILQVMEKSYSRIAELEVRGAQKIFFDLYKDEISLRFDTVYSSSEIEAVQEYVVENKADLLALCSEHHGLIQSIFHRSLIKAVSAKALFPVFIFHA